MFENGRSQGGNVMNGCRLPVQMCTVRRQLDLVDLVRGILPALGRRVVDGRGALGSSPAALADEEAAADGAGVHLFGLLVDDERLALDHRAGLALVIHAEHFAAQLELAALGCGWERLEELDAALPVQDSPRVEFRHTWDRVAFLCRVEVDYFLCGLFECCVWSGRLAGVRDGVWEGGGGQAIGTYAG